MFVDVVRHHEVCQIGVSGQTGRVDEMGSSIKTKYNLERHFWNGSFLIWSTFYVHLYTTKSGRCLSSDLSWPPCSMPEILYIFKQNSSKLSLSGNLLCDTTKFSCYIKKEWPNLLADGCYNYSFKNTRHTTHDQIVMRRSGHPMSYI